MPGSYEIDSKENVVSNFSSGVVTVYDKIAQDLEILSDPKYRKNMNVMCDLSQANYDWSLVDDVGVYSDRKKALKWLKE